MTPVVYVAGPISAPSVEEMLDNCDAAMAIALQLSRYGLAAVCVHGLAYEEICKANGEATGSRLQQVLQQDLAIVGRCDGLVLVRHDYEQSKGTRLEVEHARRIGIPVMSVDEAVKWAATWHPRDAQLPRPIVQEGRRLASRWAAQERQTAESLASMVRDSFEHVYAAGIQAAKDALVRRLAYWIEGELSQ